MGVHCRLLYQLGGGHRVCSEKLAAADRTELKKRSESGTR